uniref:Homeobox domain-containing protein n=1 Tax=Saimiri boliviensis boliviensis TaxID=39432 RepID=A0A2K6V1D4_SAIBB
KLNLREHQLQVWFKNRRAKAAREQLKKHPQSGPARRGRRAGAAPPVPATAASPGPSGILPAANSTTYSLHQAWGGPERGAHGGFLAALGPGPGAIPAPLLGPVSAPDQIPDWMPGHSPDPAQIPGPGPIFTPILGQSPGSLLDPIPRSLPSPIPGPGSLPAPNPGPGSLPAPNPGPGSLPAPIPIPGPGSLPAPISGPGSLPAPISGPGSLPAPIPGPGSLPAPIPGPGSLPAPIPGPGSCPAPISGPGWLPAPIPGPGSLPSPIPGPGSLPAPGLTSRFSPDTPLLPDFTELLTPLDPLEGSSVSTMTSQWYQHQEDGSVNENYSGPRSLLDV